MDELTVFISVLGLLGFLWELFAVMLKFDKLIEHLRNRKTEAVIKMIFLATCVYLAKYLKACPIIDAFDNGNVSCTAGRSVGSNCSFTCEKNYKLQGSANITCTDEKKWDPPLPTCELITCPEFDDPPHVTSNCSNNNVVLSECHFKCDEKHNLIGFETSSCQIDGSWSHPIPTCAPRKCMPPPKTRHGKWDCTDKMYTVGSSCSIQCVNGHEFQGGRSTLTCRRDESWSPPWPRCVCHRCKIGKSCEYTKSWRIFSEGLTEQRGGFRGTFGGHQITCEVRHVYEEWKPGWECNCIDIATEHSAICSGYEIGHTACVHATADLIHEMIEEKIYPKLCDRQWMIQGCQTRVTLIAFVDRRRYPLIYGDNPLGIA